MQRLLRLIDGETLHYAFRQVPFLVPLNAQYTGADPCAHLYHSAASLPASHGEFAEIALGFTAADIPDCGPSVISFAPTQARADAIADMLLAAFAEAEDLFDTAFLDPEDAVSRAMRLPGPVVLADVQDNPGREDRRIRLDFLPSRSAECVRVSCWRSSLSNFWLGNQTLS